MEVFVSSLQHRRRAFGENFTGCSKDVKYAQRDRGREQANLRGKRTSELIERRSSPPPIDTRKRRAVSPAFQVRNRAGMVYVDAVNHLRVLRSLHALPHLCPPPPYDGITCGMRSLVASRIQFFPIIQFTQQSAGCGESARCMLRLPRYPIALGDIELVPVHARERCAYEAEKKKCEVSGEIILVCFFGSEESLRGQNRETQFRKTYGSRPSLYSTKYDLFGELYPIRLTLSFMPETPLEALEDGIIYFIGAVTENHLPATEAPTRRMYSAKADRTSLAEAIRAVAPER
ncbi:hypothetical protein EVAR_19400_1 [Eumeta japonica]|uniref:Uncharacterized protein n=1 Tax=Eumeta variegata TaxID=151549 RepID=A0A4C1TRU0_EUMVA|nr:hypothetical protein EVAR_19400_1 [Eumeta japonica]